MWMIHAYAQNLLVNAVNSRAISDISDQFPTSITPSHETFSIWGMIYYRLLLFVCAPVQRSSHVLSLFEESCRQSQQWIHSFNGRDWNACQERLRALEQTLHQLHAASASPDDRFLFDLYRTWVSCASLVQDAIVTRYLHRDGQSDDGFLQLNRKLHDKTPLTPTQRGVYQWLLHGLVDKLTKSQVSRLPKAYQLIRTEPTQLSFYVAM